MPGCAECRCLSDGGCSAFAEAQAVLQRELPPPPLGACMLPIVEDYLSLIGPGMRVLEVGCGAWRRVRDHCEAVGARYEGINPEADYLGVATAATRLENLAALSDPAETYDVVLGTQTMEHWGENGCTLRWGLYQCFRVCKPGGRVLLNVPIHYHGTREFVLGDLDGLRRLFEPFSTRVTFTPWGRPPDPLPPLYPYPGYWTLRGRPAYVMDIQAVKDRPLPSGYHNRGAVRGRVAEVLRYPFGYNVYRCLRRARLLP
jgi:SAM-dependent methyltransferase